MRDSHQLLSLSFFGLIFYLRQYDYLVLLPWPKLGSIGAPMNSYLRKSSTMRGELAQRMLSLWKKRCLYGSRLL